MGELQMAVAPGLGRVVRRCSAVLFDLGGGGAELAAAFQGPSTDDDAVRGVKQFLIEHGNAASPLALVHWGNATSASASRCDIVVLVMGDLAVSTSLLSAVLVTGAGSQTWVERHLGDLELATVGSVDIWCGEESDPSTNLTLGAVLGGGFRLTLPIGAVHAVDAVDAGPALDPRVGNPVAEPLAEPMIAPAVVPDPLPIFDRMPEPLVAPVPAPPAPLVASALPVVETMLVLDDGPTDDIDWGDTEDQDQPHEPAPDPFIAAPSLGLVEATMCERGHSNPPGASSCFSCGLSIGAEPNWTVIEQPTVGRLVFVDGQVIPIDRRIVIGRKPTVEEGHTLAVTIDQAEVSRSHATVTVEGWMVLLTDLGSRNGTYICPPESSTPIRLDEGVQHFLEDGTTVHLGGPDASFTFEGFTP